jgi:hypothetical protein
LPRTVEQQGMDLEQSEPLLHEHEARLLGVCVSNLRSRRARRLPPEWVRIGGRVLYRPSTLSAFIQASTVRPSPEMKRQGYIRLAGSGARQDRDRLELEGEAGAPWKVN